ncbi:MAG: beta-lactamase family protein, partial [Ruminococcus sp.]|nr:beta-lactamase family protein [Ruminococcus sp.]
MKFNLSQEDFMKKLLDSMIAQALHNGDFVGANASVYQNYECIYENSFGMANQEAQKPMQKDSIFRIYSMTKPVTAVAVMQLVEQGKLHPDFPVSWYLPEFTDMKVYDAESGKVRPAKSEMRIQHLLNMTSGMPYANCMNQTQKDVSAFYYEMEQRRESENPVNLEEYCRRLAEIPLEFDPGTHWDYGTSADILGGIVQKVSGMDYREYLFKNIFNPLCMTDTDFYVPEEKQN